MVVSKVLDQEAVHRARIHPLAVLLAASVYEKGQGLKGSLKWKVNERVKKALDECFTMAFHNVHPTNRRYCLALDVSGRFWQEQNEREGGGRGRFPPSGIFSDKFWIFLTPNVFRQHDLSNLRRSTFMPHSFSCNVLSVFAHRKRSERI